MTMMQDDVIWSILKNQFCSFKTTFNTARYCKNQYNVTGLCNKASCPLANSRYATVREEDGVCYLYMKTIERAHTPAKLWERVKLDNNFMEAIDQIDKHLEYWPGQMVHKAKQRFIRITQYLIRMRKLRKEVRRELIPIKQKADRRDARREYKAMVAAQLTTNIKKELLDRLVNKKTYGDLYYFPSKVVEEVLDDVGVEDEMNSEDESEEEQEMEGGATQYVDGGSDEELEEEYEIEDDYEDDFVQDDEEDDDLYEQEDDDEEDDDDNEDDDEDDYEETAKSNKRTKSNTKNGPQSRRARVEIEYEPETTSTTNTSTNW